MTDSNYWANNARYGKLLKTFTASKPPTKNSASSANLISPSISDSDSHSQQIPTKAKVEPIPKVHLPSITPERTTISESDSASLSSDGSHDGVQDHVFYIVFD
ncbi:hypothetical protein CEXT_402371 [Caerostris extrusa]|uniref:Uncharacterized protein n=1 Tax=Caerostris extrusa TaxID=172846 RepID=A0AAV4VGC3_CAEEX|nr:hypothetical protein CEXT_402371 [Caerostris extrusa]